MSSARHKVYRRSQRSRTRTLHQLSSFSRFSSGSAVDDFTPDACTAESRGANLFPGSGVDDGLDRQSPAFLKEVCRKRRLYLLGEREAEMEVSIDILCKQQGSKDEALLHVVAHTFGEYKVQTYVNLLIHRGARPVARDDQGHTALHHAVTRGMEAVCSRLLEHGADPTARGQAKEMPYTVAISNQNDSIASLLLVYMPNLLVRSLYVANTESPAEFSFRTLLQSGMQSTILAVLDGLLDESSPGKYCVYYHILEADEEGRAPNHPGFNKNSRSALHRISKMGDKTLVYHDAVRLLIRRKWKDFAKFRFQLNGMVYIVTQFSLTYVAIVACGTPDPLVYDSALQYSRAGMEVYALTIIGFTLLVELNQMRKHRLEYCTDPFNYLDIGSVMLLLAVVPLRYLEYQSQWHTFAAGYMFWAVRVFKYAAVFRQTGAYAQILWKIVTEDFLQFSVVFAIVLLSFSGAFLLALRGEENLQKTKETRGLGTFLMMAYLFVCIVVLLNILIAQLSETFHNIQGDAQRGLELNRARIVTRVELNSIFIGKGYRESRYIECEQLTDPQSVLERWGSAPLTENIREIRQLGDSIDVQGLDLRFLKTRQARQEHMLSQIRTNLEVINSLLTTHAHAPPTASGSGTASVTEPAAQTRRSSI